VKLFNSEFLAFCSTHKLEVIHCGLADKWAICAIHKESTPYIRADEPMARVPHTANSKIFFAHDIHCCPNFFFYFLLADQGLYIAKNVCVCVCVCVHISEGVQTDYELLLLVNNTASEIFVHKSRAV